MYFNLDRLGLVLEIAVREFILLVLICSEMPKSERPKSGNNEIWTNAGSDFGTFGFWNMELTKSVQKIERMQAFKPGLSENRTF